MDIMPLLKKILLYLVLLVAGLALFFQFTDTTSRIEEKTYDEFIDMALSGQIAQIDQTIGKTQIIITTIPTSENQPQTFMVNTLSSEQNLDAELRKAALARSLSNPDQQAAAAQPLNHVDAITIQIKPERLDGLLKTLLSFVLPTLLLVGSFAFILMRVVKR